MQIYDSCGRWHEHFSLFYVAKSSVLVLLIGYLIFNHLEPKLSEAI